MENTFTLTKIKALEYDTIALEERINHAKDRANVFNILHYFTSDKIEHLLFSNSSKLRWSQETTNKVLAL